MASVASITIDDAKLQEMLSKAPSVVNAGLRKLIEGAAIDIQREERLSAPAAVTGRLRGSIQYKFDAAQLRAEIAPLVDYADAVENGSGPRWVSVRPGSPLYQWAQLKGINPYVLQRSIARKGTKPHPFALPTLEKLRPQINEDFSAGINQIIERLNNGEL